ncbi:hypothetical protein C4D60_Mb07t14230 [Musa balbisiana]|uniref:Uncharacterized protein n=1 Tax=Musa balbisiana TaxID=52838 RepID=A0A4S8JFU9_MUSBA|nr:hypothetical protein C4D60_Mb07t14230 [Musa balbisiana]
MYRSDDISVRGLLDTGRVRGDGFLNGAPSPFGLLPRCSLLHLSFSSSRSSSLADYTARMKTAFVVEAPRLCYSSIVLTLFVSFELRKVIL